MRDLTPSPTLSVVIPVYKSEEIVETLLARLHSALEGIDFEILLVNDCSPDQSWRKIEAVVDRYPRLRALSLSKNFGYDNAILAGLNHSRGAYVVIMDDDLQHAPEDIPVLLHAIQKGGDVVYADFNVQTKKQTPLKNFGSWLNGRMAEIVIQKPRHIYLSPFKILRREVVLDITRYRGPYPYVDGLIFQNTAAISQVPLPHYARFSGHGNFGVIRSLKIMLNFCTSHSLFPLRLGIFVGVCSSLAGLLLGIYIIYLKFIAQEIEIEGWASTVFATLFLGGIQLVFLGIIGEYVGRAYMSTNENPQFRIRQKIRVD